MRLVLFRDLHFIRIFTDAIKSEFVFDISKLHCQDLSSYQTITLVLQSVRLNQLRVTPLATNYPLSVCQNL